ncbi:hypothetical protein BaRGS_00008133 [Batillaria attramentaria]|uniref:Uncharacterized protein n=1 Tax=Batillaria attramentaria TaxID=370345 RepID=A0ABD0LM70_9CAEN
MTPVKYRPIQSYHWDADWFEQTVTGYSSGDRHTLHTNNHPAGTVEIERRRDHPYKSSLSDGTCGCPHSLAAYTPANRPV